MENIKLGNRLQSMFIKIILSIVSVCTIAGIIYAWLGIHSNNIGIQQQFTKIAVGENHACAIASDSQAYCWGTNFFDALGNSNPRSYDSPVDIPMAVDTSGVLKGKTIKSITAGARHTCVIASGNQAYCWGDNDGSSLGDNSTDSSELPTSVYANDKLKGKTIKSISAGGFHTCVIASDNQAYCWGNNANGQLGNNSMATQSNVPVDLDISGVLKGKTIKFISAGFSHTCVIASDNQAYCWGFNGSGALGDNSNKDSNTPVAVDRTGVLKDKTIKSISAGNQVTCVIASDDKAYCWGADGSGNLGRNQNTFSPRFSSTPVAVNMSGVLNGKTFIAISVGHNHNCAIASDNQAYCWGQDDFGQLGNNSNTIELSSTPIAVYTADVLKDKTIKSISAGFTQTCAITSDNQAYCWGYNGSINIDMGNNSSTNKPVRIQIP